MATAKKKLTFELNTSAQILTETIRDDFLTRRALVLPPVDCAPSDIRRVSDSEIQFNHWNWRNLWFRSGKEYSVRINQNDSKNFTVTVTCSDFERLGILSYFFFFLIVHLLFWFICWAFCMFFNDAKTRANDLLQQIEQYLLLLQTEAGETHDDDATALFRAVASGDLRQVRASLRKVESIEIVEETGATPLMIAASWGHRDIVQLLLDKGARTDVEDDVGRTLLMYAAISNDILTLQLALKNGAKIDAMDDTGKTALMSAAERGKVNTLKELIALGADLNSVSKENLTALGYASKGNHADVVKALTDAGCTK